jgi:flagellar motor protein MotB
MTISARGRFNVWPVFTDVMMGLVFIFMLVAIVFLSDKEEQIVNEELNKRISSVENSIFQLMSPDGTSAFDISKQNNSELLISFKNHVLFETGRWQLKNENAGDLLRDIGNRLSNYQMTHPSQRYHEIIIEGHTDDIHYKHHKYGNWYLSSMRANTVLSVFKSSGIDSTLLSPRGYASTRLPQQVVDRGLRVIDDNIRQLMRRVDVRIRFLRDSVKTEIFINE